MFKVKLSSMQKNAGNSRRLFVNYFYLEGSSDGFSVMFFLGWIFENVCIMSSFVHDPFRSLKLHLLQFTLKDLSFLGLHGPC